MSEFQICACGSAPGYPHRADCPRPLYNPSDAQFEAWEKDWLNMKTQHTPTPSWSEQTMIAINRLTPEIKGKAFDPDWFLLRQRLESVDHLLEACKSLMAFVALTGWGDLALCGSGDKIKDDLAEQTVKLTRTAIAKAEGKLP